ncbi:ABC transporter permease [Gulosibacter massiliensis]|uniref:ABC transporter permease n=2 Tax=Gulosibacter TaxID=256818 RepID=UPI000F632222|nr:ABC transporter permease [Gulosibacter massiliensis]
MTSLTQVTSNAGARCKVGLAGNIGLGVAVLIVLVVVAWAIWPGLFTATDPAAVDTADRLQAPSGAHPFGTNQLGQDVYARTVYAASVTLSAAALAVGLGFVVGSVLGLLAGYLRGWVDEVVMRIVDVFLSIPAILLSIAIVASLGFGIVEIGVAVGITSMATFARVMRSSVLQNAQAVYVEAALMSGARWYTVLWRHILPNSITPVISLIALEFGVALLAISSLSFLGFGAPPDVPEWGALISAGRDYMATAWWLTVLPGLVIAIVVLAASYISNRIARAGK